MRCISQYRWYHQRVQLYRNSLPATEPKSPLEEVGHDSSENKCSTDQVAPTEKSDENEIEAKDTSRFIANFTPKLKKREIQNVRINISTQRVSMYKPVNLTAICFRA